MLLCSYYYAYYYYLCTQAKNSNISYAESTFNVELTDDR